MKHQSFRIYRITVLLVLLAVLVIPAAAIGEVTPTPAPQVVPEVDIEALLDDALTSLQSGEFMAAIDATTQVLAADPDNLDGFIIRGVAYSRLGRNQNALEDFSQAIELAPYSYDLYIFRGDVYTLLGDNVNALLDYETSIEIYPLNEDAFSRRAEVYYQLGDTVSGDVDDFIASGLNRRSTGEIQAAIDFFTSAIQAGGTSPAVAVAYYNRGITYLDQEDDAAAIQDFTSALNTNPRFHNAYLARGISYRQADDIARAGADFQQRITINGTETIQQTMNIGDTLDVEMAYHRVYSITFSGQEGQRVTISARDVAPTMIDPLMALLDPRGTAIAGDDDFGAASGAELDALIDEFILPASGTYTLLVSHAEGGYAFGFEGTVQISITANAGI